MAATFTWCEDNGTATGSPSHGTTRTGFSSGSCTDVNWKNTDDCTNNSGTAYSASPIQAGNNSYTKYIYGKYSGSYNQISAGLFAHTATDFDGTTLILKSVVSSTYATPATTSNASLTTDSSSHIAIGSGATVLFKSTGPEAASPGSTLAAGGGYTQYMPTQLQTTSSAAAGDTATVTVTLQYNEN